MPLMTPPAEAIPLAPVGQWDSIGEAHEHALVILAMHLDCSVHHGEGKFTLYTAAEDAPQARREIELYDAEQNLVTTRRQAPPAPNHPLGLPWLAAWAAILLLVYRFQLEDFGFTSRFSNSSLALINDREWWRPFTALFLHGDAAHLAGNLAFGGLFCLLVSKSIGAPRGWLLILLGGTLGNAINAAQHFPENFSSIGASTATFAALGILVALAVREAATTRTYQRARTLLLPLVAGLILFGWLGTSGPNTDVAAHACGTATGFLLGLIPGKSNAPTDTDRREI